LPSKKEEKGEPLLKETAVYAGGEHEKMETPIPSDRKSTVRKEQKQKGLTPLKKLHYWIKRKAGEKSQTNGGEGGGREGEQLEKYLASNHLCWGRKNREPP